eukprot:CAMPEP_0205811080 /NCGR_PEP_ID=MMETSP0205-20121125/15247_1 /ASSEMBLY_ACC=CAM_ASM_000278 /TAXON_ID=36767 /ORGANISM="Euplotes focardii, Strain TN1" /LENGTH=39 /DNA_ID= /DNA_START= /DNA_END= /DNA_ORIENTATION=
MTGVPTGIASVNNAMAADILEEKQNNPVGLNKEVGRIMD